MGRTVRNEILSPEGKPLILAQSGRRISGETIAAFLERSDWTFPLPTICVVNDRPVLRQEWTVLRPAANDVVTFLSRPGDMGRGGGSSSGLKSIGSIVALVALAAFAPYAAGALLGAGTLGATMLAGVITTGGAWLISHFLQPKTKKASGTKPTIYTLNAEGNVADPMGLIPVGYGRRLTYPKYLAPPYTLYDNNSNGQLQTLYELYVIGLDDYDVEQLLLSGNVFWTKGIGVDAAFPNCQVEIIPPGQPVTLFNPNIVSATDITGQELPDNLAYVGPSIANGPGTLANQLIFDIVFPEGGSSQRQGKTYPVFVRVQIDVRTVNGAGAPTGDWVGVFDQNFTLALDQACRYTIGVDVGLGRYQARMRRVGNKLTGTTIADGKVTAHDNVQWGAFRARIQGPNTFPGVCCIAVKMLAEPETTSVGRKLASIQTRKLPYFDGVQMQYGPTRSIIAAALDMWTNTDYGPGHPMSTADLTQLYAYYQFFEDNGLYFDKWFDSQETVYDAIDGCFQAGLANVSFLGDRMTMIRDELRTPTMMLTDRDIIRGSLSIKRTLLDEQYADGVVLDYFDEDVWGPADVDSAPDGVTLQKPTRLQLDQVVQRDQATLIARHMAATNKYRRKRVVFDLSLEGRMLRRMSAIKVQSAMPQTWGQVYAVDDYDATRRRLTVNQPPNIDPAKTYYLEARTRRGGPWGPVKVSAVSGNWIVLDQVDLNTVEAAQGSFADAVARSDTQDPAAIVLGEAGKLSLKCVVISATRKGRLTTITAFADRPEVYDVVSTGVSPIPPAPPIYQASGPPVIDGLSASLYQRGVTLYLRASWLPVVGNVAAYIAQIALDQNATSWQTIYRDKLNTFNMEVPVAAEAFTLRVAVVTIDGIIGRYTQVSITVPAVRVDNTAVPIVIGFDDLGTELDHLLLGPENEPGTILNSIKTRVDAAIADIPDQDDAATRAYVDNQITAAAGPTGAFGAQVQEVHAQFNGISASGKIGLVATAGPAGYAAGYQWVLTTGGNNIGMRALQKNDGTGIISFSASQTVFEDPTIPGGPQQLFLLSGGNAFFNTGFVRVSGSILTGAISSLAVSQDGSNPVMLIDLNSGNLQIFD